MNEKLAITPLGPFIGAQVGNLDVSRPLSDAQFEQLYHALLRHQVLFLRDQAITPEQHRALAIRFGDLHIHPVYPHAPGVEEIIVLDTHQDNPPDNDNWHTDVTFIQTPPAVALLASKVLPEAGGDTLWTSGIAAYEALSAPSKPCCLNSMRSTILQSRFRNINTVRQKKSTSAGGRLRRKTHLCSILLSGRIRLVGKSAVRQ